MLGIVDKSNWQVCSQQPAAGKPLSGAPQLTVERSCDDEKSDETSKPTETTPATSQSETAEPIEPKADQALTKANNKEFAALLTVTDPCDETLAPFAAKYARKTIAFNGSIANMVNHGDAKTRYDFLLSPGNRGPQSSVGPNFKFEDESVFDLELTGDKIPSYIGEGDRFRFMAEVGEFNQDRCLFFIEPVATKVR
ncbi:MAG: DUF4839 domain-containing protein [Beijerinckiaceae bacterium]|nr:DUF4839 domain-containing protein [Beijerinckiaceae bacterium]